METKTKIEIIHEELKKRYPHTESFLHYETDWQLLFAIILSAQATDKSVNEATSLLFLRYPILSDYTEENRSGIEECIRKVGLWKSKADYLIRTAMRLLTEFDGKVPHERKMIISLPGAAYKTSGVFLAEYYKEPYIPVDTHVQRVSLRLGLVKKGSTPEKTELTLEKLFGENADIETHHQLILFGRIICHSQNPECMICPFSSFCVEYKHRKKTA